MHDVPYLRPPAPPETVSCMARVCAEVKRSIGDLPMGVQILAGKIIIIIIIKDIYCGSCIMNTTK